MNIQEIREKYPQYSDLSDDQLAQGLHRKYYADMPYEQFTSKIGLSQQEPQPQQPSFGDELGRQLQLTGRAAVEGVTDVASIFANPLAIVMNAGLKALGVDHQFPEQSGAMSQALTNAGLAAPENEREGLVNSIGRRAVSTGATMGIGSAAAAAPGVTGQVGQVMASNPVVQAASAVTGPVAADVARESGAGAGGQWLADMAGSMAPSAAAFAVPAVTRGGFRGGEQGRQTVERNIESFQRVGTTPSVGQATESRGMRGAESLLSRTPGGAGPVARKAEGQAEQIAAAIEKRAAQLSRKTTGEQAGRQIQRSISGEGGFVERFKTQQGKLFDELDNFLPSDSRVDVSKTQAALSSMNADIPGAPNVSKFFQNAKIKGIESALNKDIDARPPLLAAGMDDPATEIFEIIRKADPEKADLWAKEIFRDGKLPYEAVKKLRTLVGNEISDAGIASDVPRSKWKALYGALSEDLKGAADAAGPKAQAAWTRANNYTRAGMRRIESIDSVIDRNGGPEAIFRAATANTKEGATTLRAVMQSVDDEGKKMVSATVLRRLGLAKAGQQGELGDKFSTETFLTNWNSLSQEARRTLFDRYGPRFRSDMDQVAKVAANLREGSQVFRNPSGTSQATNQAATVGALALAVVTGNVEAAAAIGAGVGGANLSSRLMTNPRFVRWLARSTKMPAGAYGSAVNSLAATAKETGDHDLALAVAMLEQQKQEQQKTDRQGQDQ